MTYYTSETHDNRYADNGDASAASTAVISDFNHITALRFAPRRQSVQLLLPWNSLSGRQRSRHDLNLKILRLA